MGDEMRLLVAYDSSKKDEGRDIYLETIQQRIPDVKLVDVKDNMVEAISANYYALVLKPMSEDKYKYFEYLHSKVIPEFDIEGVFNGNLTLTAEAVERAALKRLDNNIRSKTIVIINQSEILGKPLAKRFIDMGMNVININSRYRNLKELLTQTKVDVLVSASGNKNFKLEEHLTRNIDIKIDLSEDLEDGNKIVSVPTATVLKERLESKVNDDIRRI